MTMKNFLFLCCCILWLAVPAPAQDGDIKFTSLRPKDGLSSNTINAIVKDRYGLLWFATEDGLNKFDGTHVTVYRHQPGDSTSLQTNEIMALHEDRWGHLWIGGVAGAVSRYDRKKDVFQHFPFNPTTTSQNRNITRAICSDHQGKLWIGYFGGLQVLDPKTNTIERFAVDAGRPGALSTGKVLCLFEDRRHRMWVGTNAGLFRYDRETRSFTRFQHADADPSSISHNVIKALAEDKQGNLWVGTTEGLNRLHPDGKGFTAYRHSSNGNSISNDFIFSLAVDAANRLWVGTEEGLNILDPRTGVATRHRPDNRNPYSLTNKSVRSILIDNGGISWLGTYRGGVNKYDKNLNLFNFKQLNALDENGSNVSVVTSFAEDPSGNIFVGTDGGGLRLFHRKTGALQHLPVTAAGKGPADGLAVLALERSRNGRLYMGTFTDGLFVLEPGGGYRQLKAGAGPGAINSNEIFCIKEDRKGNIWLGTNGGGVNVLGPDNQVRVTYVPHPKAAGEVAMPVNEYIRDIEEDRQGRIWIGSYGAGLAMLDPASGKFSVYNHGNSDLPGDALHCLLADSRGALWIGTFNGGLCMLDPQTSRFVNFSEKDGLPGTIVYEILEDQQGRIWVSTNQGISSFDARTQKFTQYTHHNGVQHNNFVRGAGLRTSDGELFFGGLEGFNYFKPEQLKENRNVSTILLTELRVDNKPVAPSESGPLAEHISVAREIHLDYKQNFALGFVALNFTTPEQNQYSYKLEGFDKDWNYVGTSNTASYTNLDPGTYVFQVRASNKDGAWNTAATSIKIYVHPPFWRTIPAYIFYVLLLAGLLLYMRHKGIQRLKRKFALEQERLQARQRLEQERREAEQRIEQERVEAERVRELDRLKIKFLTNLSHEFRTPISLIMGPVDQLLGGEKGDRASGHLQMIRRNARRLLNLVNQLLDFRKMEEHELRLHPSEGEFVSFVKEVSDSFKDLSERKKIDFVFESRIDRLHTAFDADKIERILFNLLSNAFKFTLEGGRIRLELDRVHQPADPSRTWVTLKVSDTGIGIPPEQRERIFDRFFQHATPAAVLNQGTGIGLAITKEFVQMHGGTIEVESEAGKGTSFILHLPFTPLAAPEQQPEPMIEVSEAPEAEALEAEALAEAPEALEIPEAAPATSPLGEQAEQPTILLVEDNEDFRFYLKDNLRSQYRVVEAAHGKEGWQKALSQHPQLVVSDVHMPYMDGIELCRKLKGDKRTAHIPVILLTALSGEQDQLKGLETGANDYITKPFNAELLNAKVKNLLVLNSTLKSTYTRQVKVLAPEIEMESEEEKFLSRVMLYLEENLTNSQLSVEDLSKHMGMSRGSLYNKLFAVTGQSPVEYIRSVKLEKAALLLEKSDMNIAQVAYSAGFATPNYFAKSFKAKYNMLPSEYLAKMRKGEKKKEE
ncbi:two-component regulator propeller domain-containing protein [Paraflavisolibacter sp. H34]|uniref:hybrid sensor histidine kinase/response regulator transcription factor n=1 Tax=Huijunlia imazamoxiresistens TaxID=3127457 RepID=UPI00301773AA